MEEPRPAPAQAAELFRQSWYTILFHHTRGEESAISSCFRQLKITFRSLCLPFHHFASPWATLGLCHCFPHAVSPLGDSSCSTQWDMSQTLLFHRQGPAALHKGFSQLGSPSACMCVTRAGTRAASHSVPAPSLPILADGGRLCTGLDYSWRG